MTKSGALIVAPPLPVKKMFQNEGKGEGTLSFRGFKLSLTIVFSLEIEYCDAFCLTLKVVKQKIVALRLEFVASPTFFVPWAILRGFRLSLCLLSHHPM